MNNQLQDLADVAAGLINGMLVTKGKPEVHFKTTIGFGAGEADSVLVVGNAYREFDDGSCVAVLNPDEALADQLKPSVGYMAPILKHLAAGHCDALVQVSCVGRTASILTKYRARKK
jgi:hypothetical protein